jgi:hypothetical protein
MKGMIVSANGTSWQKLPSGTTANINDVWGVETQEGEPYVLAAATTLNRISERKLLQISADKVDSLPWNPAIELHSVWFNSPRKIFAAGDGVFITIGDRWRQVKGLPPYFSRRIRGTAKNDVWVVGDFGLSTHFSGSTWRTYPEATINGLYYSVAVTAGGIIAVGEAGSKAVILRGEKIY